MAGSGSEPRYAGMTLARNGIVAITANYREGIFGFFAHPELSKETAYRGSGNYGFLDQVAAIQWVKENISAFGGDPDRITIMGESAGSMSVSALMASPLSRNIIAQAMGSSGSVLGKDRWKTLAEAEQLGVEKVKSMGYKKIADLRKLSADELMRLAAVKSVPTYNIDGYFMPKQPMDICAPVRASPLPSFTLPVMLKWYWAKVSMQAASDSSTVNMASLFMSLSFLFVCLYPVKFVLVHEHHIL